MNFRFSGHETFACRYAWLPKAYEALCEDEHLFRDEDEAMMRLGVGKNMARSARFWATTAGIAEMLPDRRGYRVTPFGHALLSQHGFDPFLEDTRTLWLLHWKLSSPIDEPLFAWYFLLNQWPQPEMSRSEAVRAFREEAQKQDRELSDVTLEQHFDTFLHSYVPTRGAKGMILEDNLDCPLTELRLLLPAGERIVSESGRREMVYSFRREEKPEISGALLAYCLADFWRLNRSQEATLSFPDVSVAHGSVGQIFKLPETALRERLLSLREDSQGLMEFQESSSTPRVVRHFEQHDAAVEARLMAGIYDLGREDYERAQPQEARMEQLPVCA